MDRAATKPHIGIGLQLSIPVKP